MRVALLPFITLLFLVGCSCSETEAPDAQVDDGGPNDPPPPAPLSELSADERFELPCLTGHAYIVRTERDVPHIYASTREDAACAFGFVMARDRFFQMDLTQRLAQGTISQLLGDSALAADIEGRQTGSAFITELYLDSVSEEEGRELDAFVGGVNAYIDLVGSRDLPAPRELQIAFPLLGARRAVDLMEHWTRREAVATGVTVLYGTSFEGGDVGRSRALEDLATVFSGAPDEELRRAGLLQDVIARVAPPNDASSAAGWGLQTAGTTSESIIGVRPSVEARWPNPVAVEAGVLARLDFHLDRWAQRTARADEGYGSNSWAVMGDRTADGASLLAGDGHLQLSVPSLFWQYGLDTELMGAPEQAQNLVGATIAGLPAMGVGTNGRVAWTQTAYFADVTDWYREEIVLDAEGRPRASRFQGEERDLVETEDVFEIADVPLLESVGRTETISRWATFDGRWIASIEGRSVTADEPLGDGETRVNLMGDWIVPGDEDDDGVVSAVSFYYGPFDGGSLLRSFHQFADADTVEDFRQAMRHFIGYGGSMMASDAAGSVLYSAYHAVPCRDYLPRDPDSNAFIDGADPRLLLDGTQYGSWSIPLDEQGRVDEETAASGDPRGCAVPFDRWPQAVDPEEGYVMHANNDPGAITADNDLFDDPFYIGGPWLEGYRAARIVERLNSSVAGGSADIEEMARIQADHHSNLGEDWAPALLASIESARAASEGSPSEDSALARMADAYEADSEAFDEVESRLRAWRDADYPTPSGVATFYNEVGEGEEASAVATTIFAHWFPRFLAGVLEDEGDLRRFSFFPTGDTFRTAFITALWQGRGAGNPTGLGSYNPETEESVFFDDIRTEVVESSEEIAINALVETLSFLRAEPSEPGLGGFGTENMDEWLWGLRHQVRFESLLADFIGDDPMFGPLVNSFNISTARLPLAENLNESDPRDGLTWFPRPGDQFDIDAANPGLDGETFTHGAGPVFRMVVALSSEGVEAQTILPGGQSGDPEEATFDDQARLWLANETIPMRFTPEEVVAGATGFEVLAPRRETRED